MDKKICLTQSFKNFWFSVWCPSKEISTLKQEYDLCWVWEGVRKLSPIEPVTKTSKYLEMTFLIKKILSWVFHHHHQHSCLTIVEDMNDKVSMGKIEDNFMQ